MAKVLVQAVGTVQARDEHMQLVTYHAGDWFRVSRRRAIELIEAGSARIPGTEESRSTVVGDMSDAGVLLVGGDDDMTAVCSRYSLAHSTADVPGIPYNRTLIWMSGFPMSPQRAAMGLVRVAEKDDGADYPGWEAAALLRGMDVLAKDVGTPEDRDGTEALFGDLRIVVYEPGAVWVRDTRSTRAMVDAWAGLLAEGVGPEHALLRALYANRVMLCTLPEGWLTSWIEV